MVQDYDPAPASGIPASDVPFCDCGYQPLGISLDERVADARRHALQAHGIEVSADQVLGGANQP